MIQDTELYKYFHIRYKAGYFFHEYPDLGVSIFKPKQRKTPFMCIGFGNHISKGTPHTINNQGPYCAHCMNAIFNNSVAVRVQNAELGRMLT